METTAQTPTTIARLVVEGFTTRQITRLLALRADYPLIELIDSQQSLDQLRFLKWRHATGHLSE